MGQTQNMWVLWDIMSLSVFCALLRGVCYEALLAWLAEQFVLPQHRRQALICVMFGFDTGTVDWHDTENLWNRNVLTSNHSQLWVLSCHDVTSQSEWCLHKLLVFMPWSIPVPSDRDHSMASRRQTSWIAFLIFLPTFHPPLVCWYKCHFSVLQLLTWILNEMTNIQTHEVYTAVLMYSGVAYVVIVVLNSCYMNLGSIIPIITIYIMLAWSYFTRLYDIILYYIILYYIILLHDCILLPFIIEPLVYFSWNIYYIMFWHII